jgi:uncharacterized protein
MEQTTFADNLRQLPDTLAVLPLRYATVQKVGTKPRARATMHEDDQSLPIIKKEPPRRSSRCGDAPPPLLLEGIAQFNAGEYWECHETLEIIWRVEPDHIRYLYQGILQVGVGFHHLRRGNWRGAVNKLHGGLAYLEPSAPTCMGVDVAGLRAEAGDLLAQLETLGPGRIKDVDTSALPRVRVLKR